MKMNGGSEVVKWTFGDLSCEGDEVIFDGNRDE